MESSTPLALQMTRARAGSEITEEGQEADPVLLVRLLLPCREMSQRSFGRELVVWFGIVS